MIYLFSSILQSLLLYFIEIFFLADICLKLMILSYSYCFIRALALYSTYDRTRQGFSTMSEEIKKKIYWLADIGGEKIKSGTLNSFSMSEEKRMVSWLLFFLVGHNSSSSNVEYSGNALKFFDMHYMLMVIY